MARCSAAGSVWRAPRHHARPRGGVRGARAPAAAPPASLAARRASAARRAAYVDNQALVEVPGVPLKYAWHMWDDREGITAWMPWIKSIKVQEADPALSTWTLQQDFAGRPFTFSWVARDLKPIKYQKIHWRSESGLNNKGAVRFFSRDGGCAVQMTISYELPEVLVALGDSVKPLVEQIIQADLERFAKLAAERHSADESA